MTINAAMFPNIDKFIEVQRYKVKHVQLHDTRREKTILHTSEHYRMNEEEPFNFYILKTLRWRKTQEIQHAQGSHGNIATRPQDMDNIF